MQRNIELKTLRSGRKMMRCFVVSFVFSLQYTFSHVFTFYHRRLLSASHRRLFIIITLSIGIYPTAHYPRYFKLHAGRCDRREIAVMDMPFILEVCQFAIAYRFPQHCLPTPTPKPTRAPTQLFLNLPAHLCRRCCTTW